MLGYDHTTQANEEKAAKKHLITQDGSKSISIPIKTFDQKELLGLAKNIAAKVIAATDNLA